MRLSHVRARILAVALVLCVAFIVAGVRAKPAAADVCNYSFQHCWGIVHFYPPVNTYTGALAYIKVYQLTGNSSNFSTAELWVCDPYQAGSCWSWVETGWKKGKRYLSDNTGLTWFWAESWDGVQGAECPSGAEYQERFPTGFPVALGETHIAKISYAGGNSFKWQVYIDGTYLNSTRACHSYYTDLMDAGGETTFNNGGGICGCVRFSEARYR